MLIQALQQSPIDCLRDVIEQKLTQSGIMGAGIFNGLTMERSLTGPLDGFMPEENKKTEPKSIVGEPTFG